MDNKQPEQKPPFHGYQFEYHQPESVQQDVNVNISSNGNGKNGEDKFLRIVMLMFSAIILSVAMLSGGYVAMNVIWLKDAHTMNNLFPILIVVGLSYTVGWIVALVGIRVFHNLVLPYVMQAYAWMTLVGILILYSIILNRLYGQAYDIFSFGKYVIVMGGVFAALVGFHLLPETHNLRPFAVPLLLFNLAHLYLILYHYVFTVSVNFDYLPYDLLFFLGMTGVSIFMLIRVGVLSGVRSAINRMFESPPEPSTEN